MSGIAVLVRWLYIPIHLFIFSTTHVSRDSPPLDHLGHDDLYCQPSAQAMFQMTAAKPEQENQ